MKLNGLELTKEEFEKQKEKIKEQKGVQLVESNPEEWITRIKG